MGFCRMSWLLVMLCSISSLVNDVFVYSGSPAEDRDALTAFKKAIKSDFENYTESWDESLVNACTWFHITCNEENRVTDVYLGALNLGGSLVEDLGNLDKLETLSLYSNGLGGIIPSAFGKLTNLKSLDLHDNFFEGYIPKELSSLVNLRWLLLQSNNLNGTVPVELIQVIPRIPIVNFTDNLGPGGTKGLTGPCTDQACLN